MQPAPAGATAAPPPSLEVPRGLREHDGFYLRVGLGGGVLLANFASDSSKDYNQSPTTGAKVDGSFAGGSLAFEFAMGGTPAPGLVIGGGFYSSGAFRPGKQDIKVNDQPSSTVPSQNALLVLFGPFVDYYLNPKAGWHIQGALGIAGVGIARSEPSNPDPRVKDRQQGGFGFMVGGGYDAWVADQWSLGGLLRVMYASTETNGSSNEDRFTYTGIAIPELLFAVTYH